MKRCAACGETKRRDQFSPKKSYCKPCNAARRRAEVARDPELAKQRKRESVQRNRDGARLRSRRYRNTHRSDPAWIEQIREYRRAWYAANRDSERARVLTRKRQRTIGFTDESRDYEGIIAGDPCCYCGEPACEIDHIIPVVAGGTSAWDNLTAACRMCNASKRDTPLLFFPETERMDDMTEYAKALIPLAAGVALCLVDKIVAGDSIPDAVWLTLFGTSPVVAAVPNKPPARE